MAAPPSKQSPSNQKMHETPNENRLKDPPPSSLASPPVAAAAAAIPSKKETTSPSYKKSESSEQYALAKVLLNEDKFDDALYVIEDELQQTTLAIRESLGMHLCRTETTTEAEAELQREVDLHEALAPFHYLYGTTLLYSIEEGRDDGNDTGAMMTEVGAMASASTTASTTLAAAEGGAPPDPAGDGEAEPGKAEALAMAAAEDIQYAWENLEAARTIVEKILLQGTTTKVCSLSETEVTKLQLDLAQIHLREGDLQRINGNYTPALGDYSTCLEILQRHNQTKDEQNNLRNLDRKIADTQFNLGLTYLTSSSDLQKELASADSAAETGANAGASSDARGSADQRAKIALLAREHCQKGTMQHVDCARTFCGILAKLCGVDPETALSLTESSSTDPESASGGSAKKPAAAGLKTTGLDDEDETKEALPSTTSTTADASQTLKAWRKAVATMVASHTPPDANDANRVSDIRQVLDEIQETIDEAERSQEGVFQAAQIKIKAQQAAAADGDESADAAPAVFANPDGSTTTIGFGSGVTSAAAEASGAKPATADARPMMVIKKKKKRKDTGEESGNNEGGESKTPPGDGTANKRAKVA